MASRFLRAIRVCPRNVNANAPPPPLRAGLVEIYSCPREWLPTPLVDVNFASEDNMHSKP